MKYLLPGIFCWIIAVSLLACRTSSAAAPGGFEMDTIETSVGGLEITLIGHATLMFKIGATVIHVDPWTKLADYTKLPDADLILITHDHSDHLDTAALKELRKENTKFIITERCADRVKDGTIMKNGDTLTFFDLHILAVPAYNIKHNRDDGQPYHPKGEGNGYVLTIGDKRVYIGGDTENTPEMKAMENIDIAFLPMNLPYTMTPEMVADAVVAFNPKVLYPYHFGDTDTSILKELLKDHPEIGVRIRKMQ